MEGNNPIAGKPFMEEIVDKLTRPLSAEDKGSGEIKWDKGPATLTDTADNLQKLFLENKWTDLLPVVLQTEEKVVEMLKATGHQPMKCSAKWRPLPESL
jgi:hypothetical protein